MAKKREFKKKLLHKNDRYSAECSTIIQICAAIDISRKCNIVQGRWNLGGQEGICPSPLQILAGSETKPLPSKKLYIFTLTAPQDLYTFRRLWKLLEIAHVMSDHAMQIE